MLWGNAGVLSLGQGVFFGLGGYCMAMFLKLEASDPTSTKIQSTPGIPDFMDWNQITHLACVLGAVQEFSIRDLRDSRRAGTPRLHSRHRHVQAPRWWRLLCSHYAGNWR